MKTTKNKETNKSKFKGNSSISVLGGLEVKENPENKFKIAVKSTKDIANAYHSGLNALGSYSKKIVVSNKDLLEGSVDIDGCTAAKYPQANRWDYVFSHNADVYFVEVHSAHTSEVSVVIKKYKWLIDWLNQQAPDLKKLIKNKSPFYWIQSKNFKIPKHAPQYRIIINSGLKPIGELVIN
jgi:hypothetical protein